MGAEWKGKSHLAKVHTLHTFTSQCRTDWRTGTGLASAHDELDDLVLLESLASHGWWNGAATLLFPGKLSIVQAPSTAKRRGEARELRGRAKR